jgi:hypothetical protein
MSPAYADSYFGTVLHAVPIPTRLARAQALKTYFEFLELRHKIEIHNLTGRVVEWASSRCLSGVVPPGLVVVAVAARYKGYRYPIEVITGTRCGCTTGLR